MSNQTTTVSFQHNLWNQYLDAVQHNADACRFIFESPEMLEVGTWLAENTQHTDYNRDGINRIEMPTDLASYLLASCVLFALNEKTWRFAPWASIGVSLNKTLYETVHLEIFKELSEKDYKIGRAHV